MKVIVKQVGEPAKIVEVDYKYRNECGRLISTEEITNEYVGIVDRELSMVVDEDGLCKELPHNFLMEMNNPMYPLQSIVGTVVFFHYKWENPWEKDLWDFELMDVTDSDLTIVEKLTGRAKQIELEVRYARNGR